MTNMGLEDILAELSKYGRPMMNQYAASATPGLRSGGSWNCEVSVPSKWELIGFKHPNPLDIPVTGWRLGSTADTPTQAAAECLEKCMALAEGPQAPYAKFVSTDMVKGK